MLLVLGILLVVIGGFLFVSFFEGNKNTFFTILQILTILCGAIFLCSSLVLTYAPLHMFLGLYLFLSGIFLILISNNFIAYSLKELWPLTVIIAGASLFCAGIYKHKKILFAYLFPSVALILLGALFMLFSLHIVHISFRNFISIVGPFLLIVAGAFLIGLFFLQQRYHQFYIEDENDSIIEDDSIFFDAGAKF